MDKGGQEGLGPIQEEAEVVAGGEDGVGAVARAAFENGDLPRSHTNRSSTTPRDTITEVSVDASEAVIGSEMFARRDTDAACLMRLFVPGCRSMAC